MNLLEPTLFAAIGFGYYIGGTMLYMRRPRDRAHQWIALLAIINGANALLLSQRMWVRNTDAAVLAIINELLPVLLFAISAIGLYHILNRLTMYRWVIGAIVVTAILITAAALLTIPDLSTTTATGIEQLSSRMTQVFVGGFVALYILMAGIVFHAWKRYEAPRWKACMGRIASGLALSATVSVSIMGIVDLQWGMVVGMLVWVTTLGFTVRHDLRSVYGQDELFERAFDRGPVPVFIFNQYQELMNANHAGRVYLRHHGIGSRDVSMNMLLSKKITRNLIQATSSGNIFDFTPQPNEDHGFGARAVHARALTNNGKKLIGWNVAFYDVSDQIAQTQQMEKQSQEIEQQHALLIDSILHRYSKNV